MKTFKRKTFLEWSIDKMAKEAGVDISKYDVKELKMGLDDENEEHNQGSLDVVKKDSDIIKIVVAHLKKDPHYYSKMKKAGL